MTASDVVGALSRQAKELANYLDTTSATDFRGDLVVQHVERMMKFAAHIKGMVEEAKTEAKKQVEH
jgi:hypothetical protein